MKIIITHQHLDGNSPEGFDNDAWLAALEAEYLETAKRIFPNAEVDVEIDRQTTASGYSRAATVDIVDQDDEIDGVTALELLVEQTANALYDQRGQEFFS